MIHTLLMDLHPDSRKLCCCFPLLPLTLSLLPTSQRPVIQGAYVLSPNRHKPTARRSYTFLPAHMRFCGGSHRVCLSLSDLPRFTAQQDDSPSSFPKVNSIALGRLDRKCGLIGFYLLLKSVKKVACDPGQILGILF